MACQLQGSAEKLSQAMTLSRKLSIFAFAVVAMCSINGCDTTENAPIDNTPHPAFSATLGGMPWSITATESLDEHIYANKLVVGKLILNAFEKLDGSGDYLKIRISSPKEGVNILMPSIDQAE